MKYWILVFILLYQWSLIAQDSTKSTNEKMLPVVIVLDDNDILTSAEIKWNTYAIKSIHANFSTGLHQGSLVNVRNYGPSQISTISIRGLGSQHVASTWNGFNITNTMHGTADVSLYNPYSILQKNIVQYGVSEWNGTNNQVAGAISQDNFFNTDVGFDMVLAMHAGSFNKHQQYIGLKNTNTKQLLGVDFFHESALNNFSYPSNPNIPIWDKKNIHSQNEVYQVNALFGNMIAKKVIFESALSYINAYRQIAPSMYEASNDAVQQDQQFKAYASVNFSRKGYNMIFKSAYVMELLDYTQKSAMIFSKSTLHKNITQFIVQKHFTPQHELDCKIENNFSLANNASYIKEKPTQNNFSIVASYSYKTKKIKATLSLQQQLIQNKITPFLVESQVRYIPIKNVQIIAKGARIYRYPTLNDLYWNQGGQTDLQAEKGWNVEYSLFVYASKKHFYFDTKATNFYYWINNWIQWTPSSFGYWTPKNTKKVFSRGLEIQSQIKYGTKKLNIFLHTGYTYILPTQVNDDALFGKQLIYETRHKFFVNYSMSAYHVVLSYSFQYTGSRYTSSDNAYSLPAFHTSDIKISYACPIKQMVLEPYFSVQNLSNTSYQMMQGRPMMGRNYMLGVIFSLHQKPIERYEK